MILHLSTAFHRLAAHKSAALTMHQRSPVRAQRHPFAMTTVSMNMGTERIRFFAVAFASACPAVVKRRTLKARSCGAEWISHPAAHSASDAVQRRQHSRRGWNHDSQKYNVSQNKTITERTRIHAH